MALPYGHQKSDHSKMALITLRHVTPKYYWQEILRSCHESLGPSCGLHTTCSRSECAWILQFHLAADAQRAIGRTVLIRHQFVVVSPYSNESFAGSPYTTLGVKGVELGNSCTVQSPCFFLAVLQDGPIQVRDEDVLMAIAMRYPALKFSLQRQQRPIGSSERAKIKHVKWLLNFDKAPDVSSFRCPVKVQYPGGDLHWTAVPKTQRCVVCRESHQSTRCPCLRDFVCPRDVVVSQYAPYIR